MLEIVAIMKMLICLLYCAFQYDSNLAKHCIRSLTIEAVIGNEIWIVVVFTVLEYANKALANIFTFFCAIGFQDGL